MRITDGMVSRNYMFNLNRNFESMNRVGSKLNSWRKFDTAKEDPTGAVEALRIRRELKNNKFYQENCKTITTHLKVAEDALKEVHDRSDYIAQKLGTQGLNGVLSEEDRKIIVQDIRETQQNILKSLNSQYSEKYVFGGANTEEIPFSTDANGNLVYNVQNKGGTKDSFIDIGLGLQFTDSDQLVVQEGSAFNISMKGPDILGKDPATGGLDNDNLYNLLGQLANELEKPDGQYNPATASQIKDKVVKANDRLLEKWTQIGSKSKFIDDHLTRLKSNALNTSERQSDVESIDFAEETMNWKVQESSYMASLQIGSQILQPSLLDFFR